MTFLPPPLEIADAPIVLDLYSLAVQSCRPGGLYMEFGVAEGTSLRAIRRVLPSTIRLYGFDSFKGLPEPWREFDVGAFNTTNRISLPNTELIEGWFSDTVEKFAAAHEGHVSFMHVDCDLHGSTRIVLEAFADRFVPGTCILFDEFFGYRGYEHHEYRAWSEFAAQTKISYEAVGRWNAFRVLLRIM